MSSNVTTVQELARGAVRHFTIGTREDGAEYVKRTEDAPEWTRKRVPRRASAEASRESARMNRTIIRRRRGYWAIAAVFVALLVRSLVEGDAWRAAMMLLVIVAWLALRRTWIEGGLS